MPPTLGGAHLRVSSPPLGVSSFQTSAPRSASVMAHQGPANTRERSSTLMPSRGGRTALPRLINSNFAWRNEIPKGLTGSARAAKHSSHFRAKEPAMSDASPANRFADGIAFIDGAYVPVAEAKLPLLDYGFLRSDACQDTISVWKGQYFRREDHLERFERSCRRLRFASPYGRAEIRDILDRCCALTGFENAY